LRNVLPFPGIESVLSLHVVETSLTSQQECTHTIVVTDTSRPLKITIVWMDPDNSLISEKMLLNNLDLRVLSPAGEILYGNNIAGDEVNNVRKLSCPLPDLSDRLCVVGGANNHCSSCGWRVRHLSNVIVPRNLYAVCVSHCHWGNAQLCLTHNFNCRDSECGSEWLLRESAESDADGS
jgi:hypothetical protein